MQFDVDGYYIKQKAKLAAENIVCAVRSSGWDALDYAQKLVEQCMKDSVSFAMKKERLYGTVPTPKRSFREVQGL